jgi:hypothetical protein
MRLPQERSNGRNKKNLVFFQAKCCWKEGEDKWPRHETKGKLKTPPSPFFAGAVVPKGAAQQAAAILFH